MSAAFVISTLRDKYMNLVLILKFMINFMIKQVHVSQTLKVLRWLKQTTFYLFFSKKIRLNISFELSAEQTIHMKCQALFSLEKMY